MSRPYKEICLRTFFMTGNWPDDEASKQGGDVERETYQWLLLSAEAEAAWHSYQRGRSRPGAPGR